MRKGSKTTKIMKGSKNRRGLTQAKAVFFRINKQEILIYFWQQRNPREKDTVSGCAVRSEHRIDILNAKAIGKEY